MKINSNAKNRPAVKANLDTDRKPSGKKRCPLQNKCGGCQYLHLEYGEQLAKKEEFVRECLRNIPELKGKVRPIMGMKNPWNYRNKVTAVFKHDRKQGVISGVYEEGTHKVLPVENCLIEDEAADRIIQTVRKLLVSFKITIHNEDSGFGIFRYCLVRRGFATNQIMVVLVTADPVFPSKKNFTNALLKAHPEITTVVHNINQRSDNMILGERNNTLYGPGYIEDILCGKKFRISPASFYQVNPVQTKVLYEKAIELASLAGQERVVDAYSGIGTIGMIASDHAKEVISVELNPQAVKDAVINAKVNGIKNIGFYRADAGEFLVGMAKQGEHIDVLFMDPPRSGSTEQFIDQAAILAPDRIVYISCNPQTLARDLAYFRKKKYFAKEAWPVDMFPWSGHVETVCLLSRKHINHNDYVEVGVDAEDYYRIKEIK